MISEDELARIMPGLPRTKRQQYLPLLQAAMTEFEITTYLREAAFLAQLAHESGQLKWFEELASGDAYEGRSDLGNTQKGDGRRYKGRGPIQLTGRANYRKFGKILGLDLEKSPKQAATPEVGFRIAGAFWTDRGLNELADARDFRKITKRINGGYRGWEERLAFYSRALMVLSRDDESPELVRVLINGAECADAAAFLRGGRIMVALRPVCKVAALRIVETTKEGVVLHDSRKAVYRLAMLLKGSTGYVALADLPGTAKWDPGSRTGSLRITE
jgi:predicted chitinase